MFGVDLRLTLKKFELCKGFGLLKVRDELYVAQLELVGESPLNPR